MPSNHSLAEAACLQHDALPAEDTGVGYSGCWEDFAWALPEIPCTRLGNQKEDHDECSGSGGQINRLKSLWREGRVTLGAIATIPSVQTVQILACSSMD